MFLIMKNQVICIHLGFAHLGILIVASLRRNIVNHISTVSSLIKSVTFTLRHLAICYIVFKSWLYRNATPFDDSARRLTDLFC